MKKLADIQKKFGLSDYEMAHRAGLRDSRAWQCFRDSFKMIALKPFFRLLRAFPEQREEILSGIEREVLGPKK